MLTAEQVRAARAMVRMEQTELADRSGVSLGTIRRLEGLTGVLNAQESTLQNIRRALENVGVMFLDASEKSDFGGAGVRLVRNNDAREWNEKVAEVFSAIAANTYRVDFKNVLEDNIFDDGEIQFIPLEQIESCFLQILDRMSELLLQPVSDSNGPDLFSRYLEPGDE